MPSYILYSTVDTVAVDALALANLRSAYRRGLSPLPWRDREDDILALRLRGQQHDGAGFAGRYAIARVLQHSQHGLLVDQTLGKCYGP